MTSFKRCALVLLFALCAGNAVATEKLHIAVAANFASVVAKLVPDFEQASGAKVITTTGSSGMLYAQIIHGAPYDIFLSADSARPAALVASGRVNADEVMTYATGRLAWLHRHQGDDTIDSLKTVLSNNGRVAVADPALAPYGQAAMDVLAGIAFSAKDSGQLVFGKNVLQALQFYSTGHVDNAIVAYSLVSETVTDAMLLPADLHRPIEQQLAITASDDRKALAIQFANFLLSPDVQARIAESGYDAVVQEPENGR